MDKQRYELLEVLKHIDPALLDYNTWVAVGMALHHEGHTAADWDDWSRNDLKRYRAGECFKKWSSFSGAYGSNITGGTIVQLAKQQGWTPPVDEGYELEWDSVIGAKDDLVVINKEWIEDKEIEQPEKWQPVQDLIKYLEILFEASENVGYVTECYEQENRYLPKKGCYDRTAAELIEELNKCNGDIGAVIGDYKKEAGAWIRFNPLDGKGVKNENVSDFRYALVESDNMDIETQNAIIRELELPVACLVHSGGKSLHAIVKIEATNYEEYRKRVDYLYSVCQKNGLEIDSQNKNPSRLSRMPGILRNENKQFLISTNIGKSNFKEWHDWIESVNDELPEPESLTDIWDSLPELSPPLIDGVLRQGHKMLLAGPSKAGKSYALIQLCCAIAEGKKWLSFPCTKGKVLYVNLELDRASCLHRFKDVYTALKWHPDNLQNIDIWNLRGKSIPMDKLAPKLIRRAAKKNYIAIIIDPIYKVITGDENSADQMARFCNQFDLVCHELGAAVVYCHHHSKGSQGGKRSIDRASGSGVFARDPDALLDLIELDLSEDNIKQQQNNVACKVCEMYLNETKTEWEVVVSQDDRCSEKGMIEAVNQLMPNRTSEVFNAVEKAKKDVESISAWRIEATLREFKKFNPINLWFNYPVHQIDDVGTLKDVDTEGESPPWKKNLGKKKTADNKKEERKMTLDNAYEICSFNEKVTVDTLAEYLIKNEDTIRRWIKEHGGFELKGGEIIRK